MALYVSAERIKAAIDRLGNSRSKRTTLFDFLIVKRSLAIKQSDEAAIAESEPAFASALDELGRTRIADADRYFFNPFAVMEESKSGFRPERYRSNGTNSTISGVPWQSVIRLTNAKPRLASLQPGYEKHLKRLIHAANNKPLPRLADIASWYWRSLDIEPLVAGLGNDQERMSKLSLEFVNRLRLTPTEIAEIFDTNTHLSEVGVTMFSPDEPTPDSYLPGKVQSTQPAQENLTEVSFDLVTALAAKNFTILTGPSGTGKSRAALKLAEGLQRYYIESAKGSLFAFISVGPDWTSPKRLMGFRSPFGKERKTADGLSSFDSYDITEAVRLVLRASHSDAADTPHFLIFDEMNLSHVERYFAPFLSLMEASAMVDAEGNLALISSDDLKIISMVLDADDATTPEAEAAKAILAEGRSVIFPANLFIVGTVNIDDTTYMFSPKVLDRAHVIELNSEKPSSYLLSEERGEPGGSLSISVADEILKSAIADREGKKNALTNPATVLDSLSSHGFTADEIDAIRSNTIAVLDGCYDLLDPIGFSFGYRASKEIFVYLSIWIGSRIANGADKGEILASWANGLDRAIIQKLLPKIHGNRRTIGDSLIALSAFLAGNGGQDNPAAAYSIGISKRVSISQDRKVMIVENQFPLSRKKLSAMHDKLSAAGFVSFVN
ncbi:DNA methyltransferase [Tardiphaga sp. vice154]|uniref:McrB family protein n=1 Tax=Tardiphaga sp. vice154 TaxID=2592814 RepID=UPI0011620BF8|nr:DNA methyltransferase [Tardiphaga sp. vice154]QDM20157.1 DNA methyltransferase [Tardiphaga sp. vice154]